MPSEVNRWQKTKINRKVFLYPLPRFRVNNAKPLAPALCTSWRTCGEPWLRWALAHLLAEDRFPPDLLWDQQLVSSRLLECEVWNRINAYQLQNSHGDAVRNLIGRIAMIEMVGPVLARALQPFPVPVRTLDAIHLAALEFIRAQKQSVQLASYDERLLAAARFLGIAEWSESQ